MVYLVWAGLMSRLGANPVEKVIHVTGDWALNFVILALAAGIFSGLPHLKWIGAHHKAAGWAALFYATFHFLAYAAAEHNLSISEIVEDAANHTRIVFGALAYVSIALAVAMMLPGISVRTGVKRVKGLHKKVVYPAALFGVVHYVWLVKKDLRAPLIYATALAALAGFRILTKFLERPA
jgi:sulfoxide reductase heme-binding subunit YedZ